MEKKCDICGLEFDTGTKVKTVNYYYKPGRFSGKWRIARNRRDVYVCDKCLDILGGLVRSYRREKFRA